MAPTMEHLVLSAVAILLFSPTLASAASDANLLSTLNLNVFCYYPGTVWNRGKGTPTLAAFQATNIADCYAHCASTTNCYFYTYYGSNSSCIGWGYNYFTNTLSSGNTYNSGYNTVYVGFANSTANGGLGTTLSAVSSTLYQCYSCSGATSGANCGTSIYQAPTSTLGSTSVVDPCLGAKQTCSLYSKTSSTLADASLGFWKLPSGTTATVTDPKTCCKNARTSQTPYFLYVETAYAGCGCGLCYSLSAAPTPVLAAQGSSSGLTTTSTCYTDEVVSGYLAGGYCSSNASVVNDPHFKGAKGVDFDFSGEPDKAFCIMTDRSFHVNMLLSGYWDPRTIGGTVIRDGKALRDWIRQLAVMWHAEDGSTHNFVVAAREGKEQKRGDGFVAFMKMDGQKLALPQVGEKHSLPFGLEINYVGVESAGIFDVDHYIVSIKDTVTMDIKLRVAQPVLQTPTDAYAHINVAFANIQASPDIHGVLGQTFRSGREERTATFRELSRKLRAPVIADGAMGAGFLDGKTSDYMSSDLLAPDCRFSRFTM